VYEYSVYIVYTGENMKQKPGTMERIKDVLAQWQDHQLGSAIAMTKISSILKEDDERERRLQTIAEDAKRARELRDRIL
jgi:hypothetical protein